MAQCLLAIPEVLSRHVLTDWLALKSVVRLDSAVCSRKLRPSFLSLAYCECTVYELSRVYTAERCVHWSTKRCARINGMWITGILASDEVLCGQFLLFQGSSLRWLVLSDSARDWRPVILTIANNCPNLWHLTISTDTGAISTNGIETPSWDSCLLLLTQSCRQLMTLQLTLPANASLSTGGLADALRQCQNLQGLCLYCPALVFPAEIAIPSLTYLNIAKGIVSEELLMTIASRCSQLQSMHMFKYAAASDAAVRALLQGCPRLRAVDVENVRGVRHELRAELAKRCNLTWLQLDLWADVDEELALRVLEACPGLISLMCRYSMWLTDDVLAACAQYCPLLECVELVECNTITTDGVLPLIQAGGRLRTFVAEWCPRLRSDALLAVAQHCSALQILRVSGDMVNDAAVMKVAQGCPQLTQVAFTYSGVSDDGVCALAQHCRRLERLELLKCSNVTAKGLRALLEHCPALRHLRLHWVPDEELGAELRQRGIKAEFVASN